MNQTREEIPHCGKASIELEDDPEHSTSSPLPNGSQKRNQRLAYRLFSALVPAKFITGSSW